jgi:hypothetical protein
MRTKDTKKSRKQNNTQQYFRFERNSRFLLENQEPKYYSCNKLQKQLKKSKMQDA